MNILVFPLGSAGDVHPFLGLALALKTRGHAVTCMVNGYFQDLVTRLGLEYVELGTRDEYLAVTEHPDLWHPLRSFRYLFHHGILRAMRAQYDLAAERYAPGRTVAISNCLSFGVRMASEKLGLPLVTVHCQPACLWSEFASPTLPGMPFSGGAPRWLQRTLFWIGETCFIDRAVCPETNRFRAELGLPPMKRTVRWWNSPHGVLCLFPEWYAPRQPDWPEHVFLTQFPLWDESTVQPPQPEVAAFLDAGEAPVVFTPGSANKQAAAFFQAAAEACHRLGRRGLLLTQFPDQIPSGLPPTVRHFPYVPFSRLLPRAAALVHHGGIGTTAQGLRAGIPQLIMPMAHDQPDNAARLQRLGVGTWLRPAAFRGPAVAKALDRLLTSTSVGQSCQRVAARFVGTDPLSDAAAVVERLAAPSA